MLDIVKSHVSGGRQLHTCLPQSTWISLVPTSRLDKPIVSLVPAAQKAVEMSS